MIAYLNGKIAIKAQDYIVIEVNNIGYKVYMTEKEISSLEIEKNVKVYTFMRVREDDISLYGFLNNEELMMFELLISVGGIGAKSATSILSNITPSQFAMAVIADDVSILKKLPGVGAKTAQRIILELKDKIKTDDAINTNGGMSNTARLNENAQDAVDALQVLGYSKKDIEKAIEKVDISEMNTEEIIRLGLKNLSH